ncbi:MAG: HEPN domain-containing protein [Tannerellaceae bacterium]|nr:HEPN domain-containing protein [Tannerellaceae bacterium]
MTLSAEERNAIVSTRLEKSKQALIEAKGTIEMGYWNTASNRLYYACYNAVSALLIKNGHTAQSHKGVAILFSLNYIKTNILPQEFGRTYSKLFLLRQTGDYDDWNIITEEDVTTMLEPAEKFIQAIEVLLNQK